MRGSSPYERPAWSDRFQKPTVKRLREGLSASSKHVLDVALKHFSHWEGVREEITWYGDSWHWTIELRTRHSREPLAVIVPSPNDLQLALPLEREFTSGLPVKRMKRAVRDGLELAQEPFDTRWGVWSLNSVGILEDVLDLVEMKLQHLIKRAG